MLKTKTLPTQKSPNVAQQTRNGIRCPPNGLPATSCELGLFYNRKNLTSILLPTFVLLLNMATPKNHKLLANPPKAGSYFSSSSLPNPVFLEQGTRGRSRGAPRRRQQYRDKCHRQQGGCAPPRPPHTHTPIGTLQVMSLSFLPMKIQGQSQLLSTQKGSITGTICQMI